LTPEEVTHIARLARVGLSQDEMSRFQDQLSQILDYFQRLQEADTENVPPTAHTLAMHNVMRDDEPQPSFDKEDILANAPQREEDLFRVRAVLE
ncbi:MAG: Asp-tRNA(Asn)/Glu-tRNA(Gln) amidotransferase subunit GatC, partial [Dehalococcoidia bacterium]